MYTWPGDRTSQTLGLPKRLYTDTAPSFNSLKQIRSVKKIYFQILIYCGMEKDSDIQTSDDSCTTEEEAVKNTEDDPENIDFDFKKIGEILLSLIFDMLRFYFARQEHQGGSLGDP